MQVALHGNIDAMENTVIRINATAAKVTDYEKDLKTTLDKRIKAYRESINKMFNLDGWRELLFWGGMVSNIFTLLLLLITIFQ